MVAGAREQDKEVVKGERRKKRLGHAPARIQTSFRIAGRHQLSMHWWIYRANSLHYAHCNRLITSCTIIGKNMWRENGGKACIIILSIHLHNNVFAHGTVTN